MQDIRPVRPLLFEAEALMMAQLPEFVTNRGSRLTRQIPLVGREAKMRQFKARLPVEKQIEPSHAPLNKALQLQYIPIEKLTSRGHADKCQ